MKSQFNVNRGTVIDGKWHQNRYLIEKELGYGANGVVYLAKFRNQHVALKMSDNGISVTSEVNVLKSFSKVQGSPLGPSLLDVDDWKTQGKVISFYVMEYIQGPDLLSFIKQKGDSWTAVLILQLLSDLDKLHKAGWVFGDLKPENLIVTGPPPKIRCIDVGGTTIQGRAIKEFTEFYDRGYWGLGSRKADPTYDLFAVAMILINCAYPSRFNKDAGGLEQLKERVKQSKQLQPYESVILHALQGKYHSALEMRQSLIENMQGSTGQQQTRMQKHTKPAQQAHATAPLKQQKKKKKGGVAETLMLILLISCLYFFYIYGQVI
ncbi:serine/threonine-protein kinase [Cytobacillus purgationiresistens]|uniref:Serine/threonine-protein kinase n=2 Tax=Cytobacillus purgationiresistens TaxID=863449 RepID=A0ABU0AP68_9BACI|nr:serine/threonine-protein kinase [Cytobacillus purgationiresistens]